MNTTFEGGLDFGNVLARHHAGHKEQQDDFDQITRLSHQVAVAAAENGIVVIYWL